MSMHDTTDRSVLDAFCVMSGLDYWSGSDWTRDPSRAQAFSALTWPDPWKEADSLACELRRCEGRPCVVCFVRKPRP